MPKSNRPKQKTKVVSVACFNPEGMFLFGLRDEEQKYNFAGGHLEPGETPLNAAKRELKEETGLNGKNFKYLGQGLGGPKNDIVVYSYTCDGDGEVNPSNDPDEECSEWKWVDPDNVPDEIMDNLHNKKDITLRFLGLQDGDVDAPLSKADPTFVECNAYSGEAIKIPKSGTPSRESYDDSHMNHIAETFSGGDIKRLRAVTIPITNDMGNNLAVNKSRLSLYKRMLKAGDRLPPVVVKKVGPSYHLIDGNHRVEAARQHGLGAIEAYEILDSIQKKEDLNKGILSSALVAGLLSGPPQMQTPENQAHTLFTAKPQEFGEAALRGAQAVGFSKWTPEGLSPELNPIAHLESSYGKNMAHAPHSGGEFYSAHGAVGFKPVTAMEEYKKSKLLQNNYPGLNDPADFMKVFKGNNKFYNLLASSHFARLKHRHGSPEAAAYAWRWGTGAASNATPEQINAEPYVQHYKQMSGINKAEDLNKVVLDPKLGYLPRIEHDFGLPHALEENPETHIPFYDPWDEAKYQREKTGIVKSSLEKKVSETPVASSTELYRSYKHSPHDPKSVGLKYIVFRLEHPEYNRVGDVGKDKMDSDFLELHKKGGAAQKNGHLQVEHLRSFYDSHPHIANAVFEHQQNLHKYLKRHVSHAIKKINGEPHIALTRGLNTETPDSDHALASYADIPTTGFGKYMHYRWVPLKNVWYSYGAGPKKASSNDFGHENEILVSPHQEVKAKKEDITKLTPAWDDGLLYDTPIVENYKVNKPLHFKIAVTPHTLTHEEISRGMQTPFEGSGEKGLDAELLRGPNVTPEHISQALNSPSFPIRMAAIKNKNASMENINQAMNLNKVPMDIEINKEAVQHPNASHEQLNQALKHPDYRIRAAAIKNPKANFEHFQQALKDPHAAVRDALYDIKFLKSEDLDKVVLDPKLGYKFTVEHHDDMDPGSAKPKKGFTVKAWHPNGDKAGSAVFSYHGYKHLHPEMVNVNEKHRRLGLASAMYSHAEKNTNKKILPSSDQTHLGRKLWEGNKHSKQFGKAEEDYRGQHQAPTSESGDPMHNVTRNVYPEDIYSSHAAQYYGHLVPYDMESIHPIHRTKNQPEAPVKIYRAVPKIVGTQERIKQVEKAKAAYLKRGKVPAGENPAGYYDRLHGELAHLKTLPENISPKITINPGDWVTPSLSYAHTHGQGPLHGNYKIVSKVVPAKHLFTNGDSIHEWGYDPGEGTLKSEGWELDKSEIQKSEFDPISTLLDHDDPKERILALKHADVSPYHLRLALTDEDPDVRAFAANHPKITEPLLEEALKHPDLHTKETAVQRPDLQSKHLEQVLFDPDIQVLVAKHPSLTEDQRKRIVDHYGTPEVLKEELDKSMGFLTYPQLGEARPHTTPFLRDRMSHYRHLKAIGAPGKAAGITHTTFNENAPKGGRYRILSGSVNADYPGATGNANHETQHMVFGRIRQRFGGNVGNNVIDQTLMVLNPEEHKHLNAITGWAIQNRYHPDKMPEEKLTYLHNYLSEPSWRETAHKKMGIHGQPDAERESHTQAKKIFQKLRTRASSLSPGMVGATFKSEEELIQEWANIKKNEVDYNTSEDLLGVRPQIEMYLEAAKFLSHKEPDEVLFHRGMIDDNGIAEAALRAVGLEVNDENLNALKAIVDLQELDKAELSNINHSVMALFPDGADIGDALRRGFMDHTEESLTLKGKHSKGAMSVKDPKTGEIFLIKPGSGRNSPALGVKEEQASQSRRETAFWHVANMVGLGHRIPRADLILLDDKEVAAIHLLPYNWANLDKLKKKDINLAQKVLDKYRNTGELHKWAVMDFILGNADRHSNNIMVGPPEDNYPIALIDHGSTFAGFSFNPGMDDKSFVPYYLRAWNSNSWGDLSTEDKLKVMPVLNRQLDLELKNWVNRLNEGELEHLLLRYGINPAPSVERLKKVKSLLAKENLSYEVNKLWVMPKD